MGEAMEMSPARTGAITKRAAFMELALFLALVFSFIWIWSRAFPHASLVVYCAGLGLTITTHVLHRETVEDLGIRFDNLPRAAAEAAIPLVPLAAIFVFLGLRRPEWYLEAFELERFMRVTAWGFLQQYLLQGFIHRRVAVLFPNPPARDAVVASIFAALHIPNPILLPVTFMAGYVFSVLFRRCPNLFVLALCHSIGSTAVAFGFGPDVLHKMRVGPGYYRV